MIAALSLLAAAPSLGVAACPAPVLHGSAPTILGRLAPAWLDGLARASGRSGFALAQPFGPPIGAADPALEAFLEGRADFAFLTREIAEADLATFRRAHQGRDPLIIPVAAGAWGQFGFVDAVAIVVNSTNPIARLSFRQLDAIFSTTRLRGSPAVVDWADLGVKRWRGRAIHVVGDGGWTDSESARALTIRRHVLSVGAHRGEWRAVADGGSEAEVVDRVAADPLAIGFTGMGHLKPGTRAVPISRTDFGKAFLPTALTSATGRYPLVRTVDLILDPHSPCFGRTRTLPLYLLSDEGQALTTAIGPFQPLPATARYQAERIIRNAGLKMPRKRNRG